MAYISKEEVANRRKAIKSALPGFKCSVTRDGSNCIRVAILEGPVQLLHPDEIGRGHCGVNPYYYRENFAAMPEALAVLDQVMSIATVGKRVQYVDSDYGSIPNFYVDVQIGKWDQPYKTTRG